MQKKKRAYHVRIHGRLFVWMITNHAIEWLCRFADRLIRHSERSEESQNINLKELLHCASAPFRLTMTCKDKEYHKTSFAMLANNGYAPIFMCFLFWVRTCFSFWRI